MKRVVSLVIFFALLIAIPVTSVQVSASVYNEAAGWNETIYAEISGISDLDVTAISYNGPVFGDLTGEDLEFLVRNTSNGIRIDIPGLPEGSYELTVETANETLTQGGIQVPAQDRSGFAHWNYTEGVGAYNDDGTLKDNAIVLYITDSNKDTVTLTAPDGTAVTGIGHILNSAGQDVGNGLNGNGALANDNAGILKKLAAADIPLVIRFIGTVTAPEGITAPDSLDYGGGSGSNGFMARLQNCKNITLEGIGSDAVIDGWGISIESRTGDHANGLAKNFEIRNLTFKNVPEDCIGVEGKQTEAGLTDPIERVWIHNCSFIYPSDETIEVYGTPDGAIDFKRGQYYTMSYCYFERFMLTNLIGASDEDTQYHITWHHNYWYDCYSRSPLVRQADMHLYNNLFEGQDSYCMSLRANAYIFSEYNTYIDSKRISENRGGGICKSYQDSFTDCTGLDATDLIIVSDKSTAVTSDNPYANFDADASMGYVASGNYLLQTDSSDVVDTVRIQSGRMPLGSGTLSESGNSSGGSTDPNYTPPAETSAYIHNFTENNLVSSFYTFTSSNVSTGKGAVTYDGMSLGACLKLESATSVAFEAPCDGNLLLIFHKTGYNTDAVGQTVKLDGADYTVLDGGDYAYVSIDVAAGRHELTRGSKQIFLYYMAYSPESTGGETQAITQKGRNLNYEDMIYVIDIFDLQGIDLEEVDITTDAGVLTWSVEEYEALSEIVYDEAHANPGLAPYQNTGFYFGSSDGIFTRDLYKEAYYAGYVKLSDGTYIYSEAKLYSPATYAYNMIGKTSTSAETKTLCVALLNYISAAQRYFDPSTPDADLVNVDLTEEQKALTWNVTDLNLAATEIPADKDVARDKTVFAGRGKNLLFEEMISLVSVYVIDTATIEAATECGTIFWTAEQFEALTEAPSIENYGEGTKVTGFNVYQSTDGQWYSAAPAVAPKDMAETEYYILGYVIHADGSVSYSGVMSYTFEQYISNMATNAKMGEFAQRLYYYERAAQAALG